MQSSLPKVQFNSHLLRKYDQALPRYTSYPPATELKPSFTEIDFKQAIQATNQRTSPLSLYFHIPFCQSACYFCGCNVIVSNNKNIAHLYLKYITKEIERKSQLIDQTKPVIQLHWGGGTPNYLNLEQVEFLWKKINQYFNLAHDAEVSIEVNPRYVDRNYILSLRDIGFNRISFGIQDFNQNVQVAVNRIQPEDMLFDVMSWIRKAKFDSVNVDLIYGLPYQTLPTFEETIQKTIELNPDRVAVFNFAYVPWLKPVQKNIPENALLQAEEKLDILQMTIEKLTHNQYQYIGIDHFAKPDDELAIAQQNGTLKRNFQGYTTQPSAELVGFGLTSISMLHDAYIQNHKQLKIYYEAVETGLLPIERGIQLHRDDLIRRHIIMELMCQFRLVKSEIETQYCLNFDEYFAREELALQPLEADGLVINAVESIEVTPIGRLLIRNIASVFDSYLWDKTLSGFSRAI